jgi:hypothetical protein
MQNCFYGLQKLSKVVATLLWLFTGFVSGHCMAATLSGTVTDEGESVTMAEVIVVNATNNTLLGSQFSDKNGHFEFELPDGVYNLNVSKVSYASVWVNGIVLENGNTIKEIALTPEEFVNDQAFTDPDGCN